MDAPAGAVVAAAPFGVDVALGPAAAGVDAAGGRVASVTVLSQAASPTASIAISDSASGTSARRRGLPTTIGRTSRNLKRPFTPSAV